MVQAWEKAAGRNVRKPSAGLWEDKIPSPPNASSCVLRALLVLPLCPHTAFSAAPLSLAKELKFVNNNQIGLKHSETFSDRRLTLCSLTVLWQDVITWPYVHEALNPGCAHQARTQACVCAQAANAEWVPCVESAWGRCTPGVRGGDLQEQGWEVQSYEPSLRR